MVSNFKRLIFDFNIGSMIDQEETIIYKYEKVLDAYIQEVRSGIKNDLFNSFKQSDVLALKNDFVELLETETNKISSEYLIPDQIKSFLLIIRDTHIEFEKSKLKYFQNEITEDQLKGFCENLLSNQIAASISLKTYIKDSLATKYTVDENEKYSEIKSPWETFKEQYDRIIEQIATIQKSYQNLKSSKLNINDIKELIYDVLNENEHSFNAINDALTLFDKASQKSDLSLESLYKYYLEIDGKIQLIPSLTNQLDIQLDEKIRLLPESIKIPISANQGLLSIKEIPLQRSIRDWTQLEVLPEIYEIWELNDEAVTKVKSTSKNVLNRIQIALNNNDSPLTNSHFLNTITLLKKDCDNCKVNAYDLTNKVKDNLNKNLSTSQFFSRSSEFLSSSWRSTIDTSPLEESPIIKNTKVWIDYAKNTIIKYINAFLDDYEPNYSETLIKYLRAAEHNKHNEYNSIFLTKSFSGKSFYVPRRDAVKIASTSLDNWINGYRGGLLVTGNRYCGKSNFIDAFATEQRDTQTVILQPNQIITINGRKHTTTFDIQEVFDFLVKYHSGDKIIVVIDDILQWQSNDNSLITSIRAILKFVDNYNSKFYVIGSMDECQLQHFDKNLNITNSFNSILNLNKIKLDEFYKVIDIRHGATHKSIVNKDGAQVLPDLFKKYINKVYQESEGNIGDSLRIWALSLTENEFGEMKFNLFERKDLPDFFNEENTILLKAITLNREVSEYQLRSNLGPSFTVKYKDILARLISIGIVERSGYTNRLLLSETIANQIADKLNCEGYI